MNSTCPFRIRRFVTHCRGANVPVEMFAVIAIMLRDLIWKMLVRFIQLVDFFIVEQATSTFNQSVNTQINGPR